MNLNDLAKTLSSSPNLAAIGIAFFMLFFGVKILTGIDRNSPLKDHVLPILGCVMAGPLILTLAILGHIGNEAVTGFLGAMVGFFFGAQRAATTETDRQLPRGRGALVGRSSAQDDLDAEQS